MAKEFNVRDKVFIPAKITAVIGGGHYKAEFFVSKDEVKTESFNANVGTSFTAKQVSDALDCINGVEEVLRSLPSAQPEPLTDYEQRIFLSAMGKERAVCKKLTDEWDGMKLDVPCPVNLLRLCAEIERKVKAALWTN